MATLEVALLVAIGVLLFGLVANYDDVHRATTNGVWKSIDVAMWADGLPDRSTDVAISCTSRRSAPPYVRCLRRYSGPSGSAWHM